MPLENIELLVTEIDSVRMTLTLSQEKVKKNETKILKAYFKPENNIMGSDQTFSLSLLISTGSATSYATDQAFTTTTNIRYKKNPSYQSVMYLNQDFI